MNRPFSGNSLAAATGAVFRASSRPVGESCSPAGTGKSRHSGAGVISMSSLSSTLAASSPVSSSAAGISPAPAWYLREIDDWAFYEEGEEVQDGGVFGRVPSSAEAEEAVSALQHELASASFSDMFSEIGLNKNPSCYSSESDSIGITSPTGSMYHGKWGSESDWAEPRMSLFDSRPPVLSDGHRSMLDVFRLLERPPVRRAVISLSSDPALWSAVINNPAVKELREMYSSADNKKPPEPSEENSAVKIMKWIANAMKEKFIDFVNKIMNMMNDLFHSSEEVKMGDVFKDTVKSSFILSILVLLVVVMGRLPKN